MDEALEKFAMKTRVKMLATLAVVVLWPGNTAT